jgi:hypothetical protein
MRPSRRRGSLLAAAAAAALLPAAPAAEEGNLQVAPSYWLADLSGDGHTGRGARNQRFDVAGTFGLDTGESVPSLEAFLRIGRSRLILGWNRGAYEGSERLRADLVYKNATFMQGGRLLSEFDYERRRILYGRPFMDRKRLAAGFLVGLDAYRIDAGLRMRGVGSQEVDLDSTVPALGASLTFYPYPSLRLYAEAEAMSLDRGGVDSRILEAYGDVQYFFLGRNLAVALGYRYADLKAEDENRARFELKQQGTFTGLVIRF